MTANLKTSTQIEIRVLDAAELTDIAGGCYGTPGSTTCPIRKFPKWFDTSIFTGRNRPVFASR